MNPNSFVTTNEIYLIKSNRMVLQFWAKIKSKSFFLLFNIYLPFLNLDTLILRLKNLKESELS